MPKRAMPKGMPMFPVLPTKPAMEKMAISFGSLKSFLAMNKVGSKIRNIIPM